MSDDVDCSVLTPVYNEERYIEQSVDAMRRQRFPGRLEFLVADGGSTDATPDILARLARQDDRIRLLANPRRTVSSGLNVALSHARGTYVARMDAHTVYPPDYVETGIRRLRENDTRWVSGPQLPDGHGRVSRAIALALDGRLGRGGSRRWGDGLSAKAEFELDTGVFAGVWRRDTLLAYGGWDEHWRVNEDAEMAARFLERGERLICVPSMAARYVPRDSLAGLWHQYQGYGRFRMRTARRHPHSLRRSALLPPVVVADAALSIAAPRRLRGIARLGLAAYATALCSAGIDAARRSRTPGDAALVPVVLAVMHAANGVGMIDGARRFGPPVASVAGWLGVGAPRAGLIPAPEPVYAPSLTCCERPERYLSA